MEQCIVIARNAECNIEHPRFFVKEWATLELAFLQVVSE